MKSILSFFKRIVSVFTGAKLDQVLAKTYDYVQLALPFVQTVAQLTPTRADDEIVALIRRYAVPVTVPDRPMTDLEKSSFLRTAAAAMMKNALKDKGISDSIIDLAVQTAYVVFKNREK